MSDRMKLPKSSDTRYVKSLLITPSQTSKPRSTAKQEGTRSTLNLQKHPEGGYFVETDRDLLTIPNPFNGTSIYPNATIVDNKYNKDGIDVSPTRNASTTIHYYLDPERPLGVFHRNKGRTVHTLHHGRGLYVLIHADEIDSVSAATSDTHTVGNGHEGGKVKARIETFVVGHDIASGEKIQWIVEGGKFKASFLLPDSERDARADHDRDEQHVGASEAGLLISETVVPGFEFADHDFLTADGLRDLVGEAEFQELKWLLREERVKDIEI